ncbi:MAG: hypothetical protein CO132_02945 [Candidatus Kerfeldbacteria bacterium CG_4_9_14_3_um_filter_45_8]|nr:MAG: hypothetical protein CO132_02945 [Candidatus Kerfeldbacteria bacterium CG_4_9_14_3_um_filter_45_8]
MLMKPLTAAWEEIRFKSQVATIVATPGIAAAGVLLFLVPSPWTPMKSDVQGVLIPLAATFIALGWAIDVFYRFRNRLSPFDHAVDVRSEMSDEDTMEVDPDHASGPRLVVDNGAPIVGRDVAHQPRVLQGQRPAARHRGDTDER